MAQSFTMSNFNYFPTIWPLCSAKDQHRMDKVQERTNRVVCDDYTLIYNDLLNKSKPVHWNLEGFILFTLKFKKS